MIREKKHDATPESCWVKTFGHARWIRAPVAPEAATARVKLRGERIPAAWQIAPAQEAGLRFTTMEPGIPLPFRLALPDDDSLSLSGIRSVSYELDGLLHLEEDVLTFEWVARRQTEVVGFTGVNKEVEESPVGRVEVPCDLITRARLRGWWWAPRLDLYARELDAFDGIPGARGSVLTLRLRPHDRALAAGAARAIETMATALPRTPPRRREIEDGG